MKALLVAEDADTAVYSVAKEFKLSRSSSSMSELESKPMQ